MIHIRFIRLALTLVYGSDSLYLGFCPASHPFPFCNGAFCCPTSKDTYHGKLTGSDCLGCENGAESQCTTSSCREHGK